MVVFQRPAAGYIFDADLFSNRRARTIGRTSVMRWPRLTIPARAVAGAQKARSCWISRAPRSAATVTISMALERLRVLGHGALQKMRRADNDGKEVIEVMRNSTCHLAERLKLLRLAQCFLGLTLLGPVEQSGDGASIFGWL